MAMTGVGAPADPPALRLVSWPSLWRGGVIALAIIFVLSTQFLFQAELYDIWPLPDILQGWLDHFLDLSIVGGCIFGAFAGAASLRAKASAEELDRMVGVAMTVISQEAAGR